MMNQLSGFVLPALVVASTAAALLMGVVSS